MQCFRCHAENAEGSRFCGHCGAPIGERAATAPPHLTDPTSQMPAAAGTIHPGLPPLDRGGLPVIGEDAGMGPGAGADVSMGASMRVPVSKGVTAIKVLLIVVIDVMMLVGGVMLLTRGECGGGGGGRDAAVAVKAGSDAGKVVAVVVAGAADAGRIKTGRGKGRGRGRDPEVTRDAGMVVTAAVDAGKVEKGIDARAVEVVEIDAGDDGQETGTGEGTGTDDTDPGEALRDEVEVEAEKAQAKMARCYTEATKALPADQPLTGEVDISFEVMPTGGTSNVSASRNTTESDQLASCLVRVIGGWRFTPFHGDSMAFMKTFRFGPSAH